MAEDNAAAKAAESSDSGSKPAGKPIILYALVVLNMLVVAGVGAMLYLGKQKEQAEATAIDKVVNGEAAEAAHGDGHGDTAGEKHGEENFVGEMIPLETFLVNLSGHRGNMLLKVSMEFEVEGAKIAAEIDKRKPQIRDIIIILLSSKTHAQMESADGKEFLREEIRDTVNTFLSSGKIKRVHFTEFIFN
ncbi:MAG: flagellar basal body-associated FliL family protein [Bdellovibrionota bacterium]